MRTCNIFLEYCNKLCNFSSNNILNIINYVINEQVTYLKNVKEICTSSISILRYYSKIFETRWNCETIENKIHDWREGLVDRQSWRKETWDCDFKNLKSCW